MWALVIDRVKGSSEIEERDFQVADADSEAGLRWDVGHLSDAVELHFIRHGPHLTPQPNAK
jgi:hypothetical protein